VDERCRDVKSIDQFQDAEGDRPRTIASALYQSSALVHWGQKWGVRGINDVAVLALAVIVFSLYFLLMTPVTNSIGRMMEFEADMYGLNAARQPDAAANVAVLLGEYRKLDPGPVEEFIFYDHPSGRARITAALRWKAEHPESASPEEMARSLFDSK
jgi:Zn-dependent protease with chaperone function